MARTQSEGRRHDGTYREVAPPERFVRTGETLVTTMFEEQDGKTRLTTTVLFPSQEVRDAVIRSGLERGANDAYDQLAEYLASATAY